MEDECKDSEEEDEGFEEPTQLVDATVREFQDEAQESPDHMPAHRAVERPSTIEVVQSSPGRQPTSSKVGRTEEVQSSLDLQCTSGMAGDSRQGYAKGPLPIVTDDEGDYDGDTVVIEDTPTRSEDIHDSEVFKNAVDSSAKHDRMYSDLI